MSDPKAASNDDIRSALDRFATGSTPQTLESLRQELGISSSFSLLASISNKSGADSAAIKLRSLMEAEDIDITSDPSFKAWLADKEASSASSGGELSTAAASSAGPTAAAAEDFDEEADAALLPFGHSNIMGALESTVQLKVDNFVDEETEEECFYTPTGVQPSSMQGVIAGDLSPLIADLQAEMAATVALDERAVGSGVSEDDNNAGEIIVVIDNDGDSDEEDVEDPSAVLLDASLPERFRVAFAGFVDGSTDVLEEQRRRSQQAVECDNTVMDYIDEIADRDQ